MKEATGSLNMTLIVVVAIGVMASFFFGVFWPSIKNSFDSNTACNKAKCVIKKDDDGNIVSGVKDGYYTDCTYESSKISNCPYKG